MCVVHQVGLEALRASRTVQSPHSVLPDAAVSAAVSVVIFRPEAVA